MKKDVIVARDRVREDEPLDHHCHFPGCAVPTPRKHLYCRRHWFMVPLATRRRVWAAYYKLPHGPEGNCLRVSQEWIEATKDAEEAIKSRVRGLDPYIVEAK